jgi:hypothetical protein
MRACTGRGGLDPDQSIEVAEAMEAKLDAEHKAEDLRKLVDENEVRTPADHALDSFGALHGSFGALHGLRGS